MKHEHLHCTCEEDSPDWRHGLHNREEAPESEHSLLRQRHQRGKRLRRGKVRTKSATNP